MNHMLRSMAATALALALTMSAATGWSEESAEENWIPLFNGKDLEGWTPKFRGQELGEDKRDTFRVVDGVLTVSYENYETFAGEFGHLFYETPYSHYRLRVEYRFVGDQCPDGPSWAFRNNGIMVHGQDPASMVLNQEFPVSVEVQLLGGDGENERSTANMCSPGTHIVMNDKLERRHCINSESKTFHGDQWVTVEIEVRGHESIRHFVNGEEVMSYGQPQLDDKDKDAARLIDAGHEILLDSGTISLQAESHPTEFRKIELLDLAAQE